MIHLTGIRHHLLSLLDLVPPSHSLEQLEVSSETMQSESLNKPPAAGPVCLYVCVWVCIRRSKARSWSYVSIAWNSLTKPTPPPGWASPTSLVKALWLEALTWMCANVSVCIHKCTLNMLQSLRQLPVQWGQSQQQWFPLDCFSVASNHLEVVTESDFPVG